MARPYTNDSRSDAGTSAPAPRWQVGLAISVILVGVIAAYWNSMAAPFVFDDLPAVRDNPTIRDWRDVGRVLSPPVDTTVTGRPIVNASLALSHALSGADTWGYHLVNLAIHAAAALALFGLVRRTLRWPQWRGRFARDAWLVALASALAWSLQPVQTEAVTYIVQRAESLMALFYLLTLYCFVRGAEFHVIRESRAGGSRWWFGAAIVACALGMGTKEVMVSAPLIVLLYDRAFVAGSFGEAWRRRAVFYGALGATWLLLIALVVQAGGNRGGSIGFGVGIGWWAHALTQLPAITHYLRLSLWPHPLVFDYEPEWITRFADVAPQALVVAGLLAITLHGLWRNRASGFVGAWGFAVLAPTSLLPAPTQLIVEHRMYLPLAAWLGLLVTLGCIAAGRRALAALIVAALAGGLLTMRRNQDYRSEISLWADTVAKRPLNGAAHGSLANALSRAGQLDAAISHATEAVRLEPTRALLHYDLGLVLAKAGRFSDATAAYAEAVRLEPDFGEAHGNYGVALARTGRTGEARREFETAVRLQPSSAEAHFNLGAALSEAGRKSDAIDEFATALRLKPDYAAACVEWGTALAALGRLDEAMARYEQALRINPRDIVALNKAGLLSLARGRVADAIARFEAALRIAPDDAAARANLDLARSRAERNPAR